MQSCSDRTFSDNYFQPIRLQLNSPHDKRVGGDFSGEFSFDAHILLNRHNRLTLVVVLIVRFARKSCLHSIRFNLEAAEVEGGLSCRRAGVADFHEQFLGFAVVDDRLAEQVVVGAVKFHAIAIIVIAARLAENLLNVVAASEIRTVVVEINQIGVPVGGTPI